MKKEDFVPGKFLKVVDYRHENAFNEVYLLIEKVNDKNIFTKDCFSIGIVGKSSYERKHKQVRWSFDTSVLAANNYDTFRYVGVCNESDIPESASYRVVK